MPTTRSAPAGRIVVFTDLDGTLLRHEDYDWSAAREALAELARRRIPLILASSKTRAEIELWRSRLSNHDPFISENGGALYVPPGSTPAPIPEAAAAAGCPRVEFGTPYSRLRAALRAISGEMGVELRGFGDAEAEEIARWTGLSGEELARARQREYDEPFVPARPLADDELARLRSLAAAKGLRVTRGGRFHHLTGANSKGDAVRVLMSGYRAAAEPVVSVGLGDGPNDLELLRAVNHAIIVARPAGDHAPELCAALPEARRTAGAGPEGFAEGVLGYLSRPW
jgi:mannosyl-3-phosphoglycerate phosphatase